ncbi:MAG TPA: flagellar motor protein MotB [Syntrophorhabdaceae bacterium]
MTFRRDFRERPSFDYDEEPMPSGHWAVPWSDLMMVAFVLFAVLYSYVLSHRDFGDALKKPAKGAAQRSAIREGSKAPGAAPSLNPAPGTGEAGGAAMEDLFEALRTTVKVSKLEDVTVALEKDKTIKVSVGEPLMFDLGRAELKPGSMQFLRELADRIVATKYKVVVEGHTDSFPVHSAGFTTNWELSAGRAVKVARFLIEDGGLEPERFSVVGYSMYKPVAPNTSAANKAKNRRVEIVITKEKIE